MEWMACERGWHAIIIVIIAIEILSWRKNVECLLLKQKWENVPNSSDQWFKRRTWLEEQVLLYIIWTGNGRILNISEPNGGKYVSICVTL